MQLNLWAIFIYLAALLRPLGVVLVLPALFALFFGELLYAAIFAALALTCFFLGKKVNFKAIVLDSQEALVIKERGRNNFHIYAIPASGHL